MLIVKQIKSAVKTNRRTVETLKGLGLRRVGQIVELKDTPEIRGMVNKVSHLVATESSK